MRHDSTATKGSSPLPPLQPDQAEISRLKIERTPLRRRKIEKHVGSRMSRGSLDGSVFVQLKCVGSSVFKVRCFVTISDDVHERQGTICGRKTSRHAVRGLDWSVARSSARRAASGYCATQMIGSLVSVRVGSCNEHNVYSVRIVGLTGGLYLEQG